MRDAATVPAAGAGAIIRVEQPRGNAAAAPSPTPPATVAGPSHAERPDEDVSASNHAGHRTERVPSVQRHRAPGRTTGRLTESARISSGSVMPIAVDGMRSRRNATSSRSGLSDQRWSSSGRDSGASMAPRTGKQIDQADRRSAAIGGFSKRVGPDRIAPSRVPVACAATARCRARGRP